MALVMVMIKVTMLTTVLVHMEKVHSDCIKTGTDLTRVLHTLENATS